MHNECLPCKNDNRETANLITKVVIVVHHTVMVSVSNATYDFADVSSESDAHLPKLMLVKGQHLVDGCDVAFWEVACNYYGKKIQYMHNVML